MPFSRFPSGALLAMAFALWLGSPSLATTFVRASDEAMVDESPLIVVGRVLAVDDSVARDGGSVPATEYRVRVERWLKGSAPARLLRVLVDGGRAPGDRYFRVAGAPVFALGERALLFLRSRPDGTYGLKHFVLGAFHQLGAGSQALAWRDFTGAIEMRPAAFGPALAVDSPRDEPRDFAVFAAWIRERAAGRIRAADYLRDGRRPEVRAALEKYVLLTYSGAPERWFLFDDGGSVAWKANLYASPPSAMPDGGLAVTQIGLGVWNADPATPIDYEYAGTTTVQTHLGSASNSIQWNDPLNDIGDPFVCISSVSGHGILGRAGPVFSVATQLYQGAAYHSIVGADAVINRGIDCFLTSQGVNGASAVLTHELGHTLGVGHSADTSALMYPALAVGRGPSLGSDDLAAVACVYAGVGCGGVVAPPATPSGLGAFALSSAQIQLNWNDNASDETGYRVEVKPAGGSYALLASLGANVTTTVAAGLSSATTYLFRVQATGSGGTLSGYSNEASATTLPAARGNCTADATTLCLDGGRFRVQVTWRLSGGQTGVGTVVPVLTTADSGVFWFFAANNWEMAVKVLNGCGVNGRHWVFFGAATNQGFTLSVTDTERGGTKLYQNPVGVVSPIVTDTDAFATCP